MLSGQGNELSLLCRLRRTVQYFRSVYAKLRNQVEFFFQFYHLPMRSALLLTSPNYALTPPYYSGFGMEQKSCKGVQSYLWHLH